MLVLWARRSLEFVCCRGQGGKGGTEGNILQSRLEKRLWKLESVVETGIEVD